MKSGEFHNPTNSTSKTDLTIFKLRNRVELRAGEDPRGSARLQR